MRHGARVCRAHAAAFEQERGIEYVAFEVADHGQNYSAWLNLSRSRRHHALPCDGLHNEIGF